MAEVSWTSPFLAAPYLRKTENRGAISRAGVVNVSSESVPDDLGEGPSFYPADTFERAKVKELMKCIELYIELPARRVYGEFFTRPVSDQEKQVVRELLESGFAAFQSLARFEPYLAGAEISYADFFGLYAVPTATAVTREVYGWDTYNWISGLRDWLALMQERDTVKRIEAERQKVEDD